jgi:hypothetical protein
MSGELPTTHDLVTLAVVVVIVAIGAAEVVLATAHRRRGGPSTPVSTATWAGWIAAACSIAAAIIHLAVIEDHLAEYVPFGIAFALLAIFQLAWPLAYLPRPTRWLAVVAVAINLGAVGVWVWSRSLGLPIGPEPGVPEAVGPADTISSLLEIGLALALLPTLVRRRGSHQGQSRGTGLEPAVAVLVIGAVAGLATFGALVALFSLSQPA